MALQLNYTDPLVGSTITDAYFRIDNVKVTMNVLVVTLSIYANAAARADMAIGGVTKLERLVPTWPINDTDIIAYTYAQLKLSAPYDTAVDV